MMPSSRIRAEMGPVNEVISGIAERDYIPKLMIIPGGNWKSHYETVRKLIQDIDGAIDELDFNSTNKIDIGKPNGNYLVISLVLVHYQKRFTMLG